MAMTMDEPAAVGNSPEAGNLEDALSLWGEMTIVALLTVGFTLTRAFRIWGSKKTHLKKKVASLSCRAEPVPPNFHEAVQGQLNAGSYEQVLELYRESADYVEITSSSLAHVTAAFLKVDPAGLVKSICHQLERHGKLRNASTCEALVDLVAQAGQVDIMEDLVALFSTKFGIATTHGMLESMAGAYAYAGSMEKMEECLKKGDEKVLSGRGCCTMLRGVLHANKPDEAVRLAKKMNSLGYTITTYLVTALYRCLTAAGRTDVVDLVAELPPTPFAVNIVMTLCGQRQDVVLARKFLAALQGVGKELPQRARESLLKLYVSCGDPAAHALFEEMQQSSSMTEGYLLCLMMSCYESRFLRFALGIADYVKSTSGMTLPLYTSFMKVYAACGKPDKACELYDEMRAAGIEPDQAVCAPIIWYAEECGRQDLAASLTKYMPEFKVLRWMSLLRSCVKDKNIKNAFAILQEAHAAGHYDHMLFNSALDVCAAAGDTERAHVLLKKMQEKSTPDIVSYNTVLKAYSARGDLVGARRVLAMMEQAGLQPNDVSYNVLINVTVAVGTLQEAWKVVQEMTDKGVTVDRYTISVLLKAVKRSNSRKDLACVFDLMDRLKIDVCSDDVLMNAVLEMCMRYNLNDRMAAIVQGYSLQRLRPQRHTYAGLIRACGAIGDLDRCMALWEEMVNVRCIERTPASVAAMVDALASNGRWMAAAELIESVKATMYPSTTMYNTLLKAVAFPARGFAAIKDLRSSKLTMTTMLYNLIIDSQLKSGHTHDIWKLLEMMREDKCAPDSYTISLEVKAYCLCVNLKGAFEAFDRARGTHNGAADTVAFNTLLDGCVRHNDVILADQLLEKMDAYGIKPTNYTLSTIVKMWGRRKDVERCFATVELFSTRYDISPNGPVKTCLMSACVLNKDLPRALEVYESIVASGHGLDGKAQGAMVAQTLRHGRLDDAVVLLDLRGGTKVWEVDADVFEQLAQVIKRTGRMEELGVPLFARLREAGVRCPAIMTR